MTKEPDGVHPPTVAQPKRVRTSAEHATEARLRADSAAALMCSLLGFVYPPFGFAGLVWGVRTCSLSKREEGLGAVFFGTFTVLFYLWQIPAVQEFVLWQTIQ